MRVCVCVRACVTVDALYDEWREQSIYVLYAVSPYSFKLMLMKSIKVQVCRVQRMSLPGDLMMCAHGVISYFVLKRVCVCVVVRFYP